MRRSLPRRACALVVVLALLVGMAPPGAGSRAGCVACPPGCPMHAQRIGCHHARKVGCHKAAPASGIRSACHAQDPADEPGNGLRGILPLGLVLSPRVRAGRADTSSPALAMRPLPEPPTAPPRASLA